MDKIINIEKTAKYREQIKELFKEFASGEIYETWKETFEFESATHKKVIISYHGSESLKAFKKACKVALLSAVYSVFGEGKKLKFVRKGTKTPVHPKMKKKVRAVNFFALGMVFVLFGASVVLIMCNYIGNRKFRETFYITSSIKADSPIRVVQVSDLHTTSYGQNNEKLLGRIEALDPDIIICTGDIVNSAVEDAAFAASLGEKLSKIAPSYYVYGNNEVESIYDFPLSEKDLDKKFGFNPENRDETALLKVKDSFEEMLENAGIKVLKNEMDTITVKNMEVDIYGVLNSNPSAFWSYSGKSFSEYIYQNPDHLKITAVHEPFIFEEFKKLLSRKLL